MEHKIDILVTELYNGKVCAQRYYLRHVLIFLAQHPEYLERTATELCKALRWSFPSFYRKDVRYRHIYEVLRQCDRDLTARGITPGGTMEMLRALMERVK